MRPKAQPVAGIRELKARLSHYLQLVKDGETVTVTEHGVTVGRIVPAGDALEERLVSLCKAGQAEWSGRRLRERRPLGRSKRSVAELLVKDRG
jgi:prevent-host-death family protein